MAKDIKNCPPLQTLKLTDEGVKTGGCFCSCAAGGF